LLFSFFPPAFAIPSFFFLFYILLMNSPSLLSFNKTSTVPFFVFFPYFSSILFYPSFFPRAFAILSFFFLLIFY
jgi:hypothetical protein